MLVARDADAQEAATPQPIRRLLLAAVRCLDGEKDPRNLLLYLQLLRLLCERCEAGRAAGFDEVLGEAFESLASYFPISFTPPTFATTS